jgi:branched-chain amino acid aminotransferase
MKNFLRYAYLKGKMIPFNDANISVATHALHYGTAAFGGMRGIVKDKNVTLFRIREHAHRLSQSARLLLYEISPEKIEDTIKEFVLINRPNTDFYIRPLIYTSSLEFSPRLHDLEKDFLIYGVEFGDYLKSEGVTCCFSSWIRQQDSSVPLRGKISGSYITSCLAKSEAVERGFDEAILMNSRGKVAEGSAMNIFIVKSGRLITPSINEDILEGITRDSIIVIARDLGVPVEERPIDRSELLLADEVFLSGTAAKVVGVNKIENYTFKGERLIFNKIKDIFAGLLAGEDSRYDKWITRVSI